MNEKREKENLVFGVHPVMEALRAKQEIERVYISRTGSSQILDTLRQTMMEHQVQWVVVPVEKLDRMTRGNHQGVIAVISPIIYANLEELITSLFESGQIPLLLYLDRITDVRNMGAIARSAVCFGVHGIIVPASGSAPISADTIRASAGALFSIPVCRTENIKHTIALLKSYGIAIVTCTEKAAENIASIDLKKPLAIVLGSEEQGPSHDMIKQADHLVKIPITGNIESLNVSVAAGVALYEVVRQNSILPASE